MVGHTDADAPPRVFGVKFHRGSRGGVFECIVQQNGEQLCQTLFIAPHRRERLVRERQRERMGCAARKGEMCLIQADAQRVRLDLPQVGGACARIAAREDQQIVRKACHARCLLIGGLQECVGCGALCASSLADAGADDSQRRAQFMARRGDKFTLALPCILRRPQSAHDEKTAHGIQGGRSGKPCKNVLESQNCQRLPAPAHIAHQQQINPAPALGA